MTKIIDGRKAEITNSLQVYTNWVTLATEHGYPKAAYVYGSDPRSRLNDGNTVTVLTSTFVHDGAMIWVVQARNGEQFLYSEKGLRILPHEAAAPIAVLSDESLDGVLREYHEIERTASDGDRVIYKNTGRVATCYTRSVQTPHETWTSTANSASDMYVLEPTEIIVIDGVRYTMVDRKAAVGERVIITKTRATNRKPGDCGVCTVDDEFDDGSIDVDMDSGVGVFIDCDLENYAVLEPAESAEPALLSAQPAESQAAASIASLALRLTQAEAKIAALEAQFEALYDWHRRAAIDLRVAREDIVLIEEGVSSDIKVLDERITTLEVAPAEWKVASGPADTERSSFASVGAVKSAQQIRDEIVERAKADVSDLLGRGSYPVTTVDGQSRAMNKYAHYVDYVVNREKRTVVAIVKHQAGGKVRVVGKSKCAPGETFNAHIGRAIALHRALGLMVPAEYLDAPGPTEVRVGDVVIGAWPGGYYSVDSSFTITDDRENGTYKYAENPTDWINADQIGAITDDSQEDITSSSALKGAA